MNYLDSITLDEYENEDIGKKLTFEQLCPLWSKHLNEKFENILSKYSENGKQLDMEHYGCCIMGEAWNFQYDYMDYLSDGQYLCDVCEDIAKDFGETFYALDNSVRYHPTKKAYETSKKNLEKDYERTKIKFVNHLNRCMVFQKFKEEQIKK